ncbi:hypothetical protein [Chitinophaga nivalis]|uniref:DUF4296 domain-containing protein n=1 Tax=Chitinophaga nivalis TaxID=2991709 RepID=A0ABT3ISF7_9BACT|nr:hypothetical protein [Chitinophaga nivalis]MCW3463403.1 hypothetical protein [Chitinophaga nivalis]MCW3486907.1 hypothetical protein [Chitinophaga nivalis]
MKTHLRTVLLTALSFLLLYGCVKHPGFPPINGLVKKVTTYDLQSGKIIRERHYTYNQQHLVDTLIEIGFNDGVHGFWRTMTMNYDAKNFLQWLTVDVHPGPAYVSYTYWQDTLRYFSSELFPVTVSNNTFYYREYRRDRLADIFSTSHTPFYQDCSYYLNPQHRDDADSIIVGSYQDWPDETKYTYTRSAIVNPDYRIFRDARFFEYRTNGINILSDLQPGDANKHLPLSVSRQRLSRPDVTVTNYSYEKDQWGRVIKAYELVNGTPKLYKTFTY